MATGGANNCFQQNVLDQSLVQLTYISCNAGRQVCAWSASYFNLPADLNVTWTCTTGTNSANGGPYAIPSQTVPSIASNQFAVSGVQTVNAPFASGTCYRPAK